MKSVLALLVVAGFAMPAIAADKEAPKTKKVCVDVMKDGKAVIDPKTKQPKQNCKEVKIREKHEATKVPEKKK